MACPVWHHPECPLEPPGADPHAGWCGRGAAQRAAPYADPEDAVSRVARAGVWGCPVSAMPHVPCLCSHLSCLASPACALTRPASGPLVAPPRGNKCSAAGCKRAKTFLYSKASSNARGAVCHGVVGISLLGAVVQHLMDADRYRFIPPGSSRAHADAAGQVVSMNSIRSVARLHNRSPEPRLVCRGSQSHSGAKLGK